MLAEVQRRHVVSRGLQRAFERECHALSRGVQLSGFVLDAFLAGRAPDAVATVTGGAVLDMGFKLVSMLLLLPA